MALVLQHRHALVGTQRRVVDRRYADVDPGGLGHPARRHRVGKRRHRPVEVGQRREHQLAAHQGHAAVGHRHRGAAVFDGRPVNRRNRRPRRKAVVAQHGHGHRRVFVGRRLVGDDVRHRGDNHGLGRRLRHPARTHRVGIRRGAVEIRCRREGQHVAGRQAHRAVADTDRRAARRDRRAVDRRDRRRGALKIVRARAVGPRDRVVADCRVFFRGHAVGHNVRHRRH